MHVCRGKSAFVWKKEGKERKKEVGGGIKPVSWGLFSMSGRRLGGVFVLTGQSHSCMIWTHTHTHTHILDTYYTQRGTRLFFCIIYEILPLSLVLHLASTECQEKRCACESVHATRGCVTQACDRACVHFRTEVRSEGRWTR